MSSTPTYSGALKAGVATIVPADTTAKKVLATGASAGTKVLALYAAGEDTATRNLNIYKKSGGVYYQISCVAVPSNAGRNGVVANVDLLAAIAGLPVDQDGQAYLLLESGQTLEVACTSTVTAAKDMFIFSEARDF